QVDRVVRLVGRLGPPGSAVAVLGLSYKPQTPVVDESQGVMIARGLAAAGHEVIVTDPLALESAGAVLGDTVVAIASAEAAIAAAEVIVITKPAPEFRDLPASAFAVRGKRRVVLDCWRILSAEVADVADVVHLGRSFPDLPSSASA